MKLRLTIFLAIAAYVLILIGHNTPAQNKQPPKKDVIPHAQDRMPGPPLSPQEAIKKMQVPPGFRVELVASEPDIVNPVAMTFDERGRIWITESLEYPKKAAGPGKDRVKVLESTKGNGKFDKVTTVIDGLNIPSGIAIGHGGVWLANAPDILFYPFEDFAGAKLGKPQVVVTGFGRFDTHELPNSLTWGPDGFLYGLNGVFNRSVIKQDGKTFDFTCALFRIHPKTKKFEIFCEGTSNPWGLAFNDNGDAFVSACVIDHLWHLTETGYYHRQGGAYPPYTWKLGSIVKHKHQKAAYCGLCWFDSDAYPPEYREKMYMGNIHGGAINVDELSRDGSTYIARPALSAKPQATAVGVGEGSNFLVANDAWFMPVAQKVGPDGCLYILDWYDRYHCYQDANRDPAGIDRLKGRLYRVVYKDYKAAGKFDLAQEGLAKDLFEIKDDKLIGRLSSPNIYFRETAQRLLSERYFTAPLMGNSPPGWAQLEALVRDPKASGRTRLHALWAMMGADALDPGTTRFIIDSPDAQFRAWGVRESGRRPFISKTDNDKIRSLARDTNRDVLVQVAVASTKLSEYAADEKTLVKADPLPILLEVLAHCGDDKLIPHIVWQNLHPYLEKDGERFLTLAAKADLAKSPGLAKVLPRAIDRILGNASGDPTAVVKFIEKLTVDGKSEHATLCLTALSVKVQNGEIAGKQLANVRDQFVPKLRELAKNKNASVAFEATLLSATLKDVDGLKAAGEFFLDSGKPEEARVRAFNALVTAGEGYDPLMLAATVFEKAAKKTTVSFRGQILSILGKRNDREVADLVIQNYASMEPELQPKAIELLTQRPSWAKSLFNEIADKKISKDVINVNQARRLLATKDADLRKLIEKHWGIPRDGRNPEREKLVAQYRDLFTKTPGDPKAGAVHFKKICAQCHKMHGEGVDVGPDITVNGRGDFDQLLSNVFDPSLVIGSGYQGVTVNTKNGQVISGLVVEDNKERVVLKVQGGELKTIARKDVDEQFTSKLSMMPEDLEKQLRPQEIVDLLSYLSLDRPPSDPKARKIPGTPR
jgi:putative membrane-bound dehydrogenase-like protein